MTVKTSEIPFHPEGYYERSIQHAQRGLKEYKKIVFRDSSQRWLNKKPHEMRPDNPFQWERRLFHRIDHYTGKRKGRRLIVEKNPEVKYDWDWQEDDVFGGLAGFFEKGVTILDLGSGMGEAVKGINGRYRGRNIRCIGLDHRYWRQRPKGKGELVGGHFRALPFFENSFDRILSVETFPVWLPKKRNIRKYFQEITRVSREGAIWRGTLYSWKRPLAKHFIENGWELVVDVIKKAFIAKLVDKPSSS